jgi:hypothetical protein
MKPGIPDNHREHEATRLALKKERA